MSDPLYFTGPDGILYRVLDIRLQDCKTRYADPPAAWATGRIFRPKDGWKRHYTFKPGEDRTPSEETLRRQLASAGYLAREKFDPSSRTPEPPRAWESDADAGTSS